MTSPLETAGAVREPSEYATISMDRSITGLWTQRSPLRDADVPYLYGKFYSASRFDSLIDGINREITARLTAARRAGCSVYNSNIFPAINSFYAYKRIVAGAEIVRVIADGQDGNIYDATAGQKSTIFTKSGGAGKARFQGVNTSLFFSDGVENKKWLQPGPWTAQTNLATTSYQVGTTVIDSNGNIEYLTGVNVGSVSTIKINSNTAIITFNNTPNFQIIPGMFFKLSGLVTFAFLNNQLLCAVTVNSFVVTASFYNANVASASDSGTATCTTVGTPATTGNVAPTWGVSYGNTATDGSSTWQNFGTPVFDWGPPAAPTSQLTPLPFGGSPFLPWVPFVPTSSGNLVLATNGQIQAAQGGTVLLPLVSGSAYPQFNTSSFTQGVVVDGQQTWYAADWLGGHVGVAQPWKATTNVTVASLAGGNVCIDSNGNVQMATAGAGTSTGGSAPTWATTVNATTTDGTVTWTNRGPWKALTLLGWKYGYAFHCIDGSVSNMSPLSVSTFGVNDGVQLQGVTSSNLQVDSVWIFRTAGGQSTPIFLGSVPNTGGGWLFLDSFPDSQLNPFITGPQATNNAPPVGMTAPVFHLGRMWAIYLNTVIASGGPDTLTGNGNTVFPASLNFPCTDQPIRLFSGVVSTGPALFVWATSNIWVILGSGTASDPFRKPAIYLGGVGILSYDAICMVGSTAYAMTAKGKVVSLDPGAGYVEVGFPIGDQFLNVTTGAGGKVPNVSVPIGAIYNPAAAFVSFDEHATGDSAVYVADGSVGWFRYSPVASPESGFLWSPRAALVCASSAVQSTEVTSGITQLLIGPVAGGTGTCTVAGAVVTWVSGTKFSSGWVGLNIVVNGASRTVLSVQSPTQLTLNASATSGTFTVTAGAPILFRDAAVNADWLNGSYRAFPSYDVKGNIVLCQSGEVAEIAHVGIKSIAIGARPIVGLLLGEISATQTTPFDWLDRSSSDPPDLPDSTTMYSDRYTALQNGVCPKCDNFQLAIDYGTQSVADEMLTFSVYGAKHAERKQQ